MKIKLYYDTISRIPLKQVFFLFKEKVFKRFFNISRPPSFESLNKKFDVDKKLNTFRKNLERITVNDIPIWDIGIKRLKFEHRYDNYIFNVLERYKKSNSNEVLSEMFNHNDEDIEFLYNIQRFHKFDLYMGHLLFSDEQKIEVINFWIKHFPPQKGLAWTGFNCSIRVLNWIKIIAKINRHSDIPEFRNVFLSILQNIDFVQKNIEHHIPGNHVIFQYFLLWLVFFLIDDERKSSFSANFEQEFLSEFLPNGTHFELSSHYHVQTLLLGLYYKFLMENVSARFSSRLKSAMGFFDAISFANDKLPLIGDNCYNFFHHSLSEDASNINEIRKFIGLSVSQTDEIMNFDNEYLIAEKNRFKLIFDVGNLGLYQNPGHGHADLLNVLLAYEHTPIFIDAGTRRYSNNASDLTLKRTISHNTLSVNGEDQAFLWGFFRWAFLPVVFLPKVEITKNVLSLSGKFTGYFHFDKITHSRNIELHDNEIVIKDNVSSHEKEITFIEQTFVLAPQIEVTLRGKNIFLSVNNLNFSLTIENSGEFETSVSNEKIFSTYDKETFSKWIKIKHLSISNKKFQSTIRLRKVNEQN